LPPPTPPLFPYTPLFRSRAGLPRPGPLRHGRPVRDRGARVAGAADRRHHGDLRRVADGGARGRLVAPVGAGDGPRAAAGDEGEGDRKSTRLNSSHVSISY